MKTCILSALVAAVVMAEDSPTMQSSEARRDMAAFRDHRPSHPSTFMHNFTFHETHVAFVCRLDVGRRGSPRSSQVGPYGSPPIHPSRQDDKESEDAA
ncbi:hypothetical protein Ae201684P_013695 [Aphanomyces euteiches]|nr:hypothetical protein Ae201684P_013695 [Aphanomyces euteiches]